MRVGVIGGFSVSDKHYRQAREVGRLLGEHGHEIEGVEAVETPEEAVAYVERSGN
jgi:methylmalonyl-CoA mutase cobalamin-binding subunit